VNGRDRQFYDYYARGAPYGPMTALSLPGLWSPRSVRTEVVIPRFAPCHSFDLGVTKRYGFKPSFNETYEIPDSPRAGGDTSPLGIDQGPVIL